MATKDKKYADEYRAAHRQEIREYDRQWAARNREKRAEADRKYYRSLREQVLERLGGKCVQCGYDENPAGLQIDHINNDGYLEKTRGVRRYQQMLDRDCDGLQVLCGTCHCIKTWG